MKHIIYILFIINIVFFPKKLIAQVIELDKNSNIIQIQVNQTGVNEFLPSWGGRRPWDFALGVSKIIIKERDFDGENRVEKQIGFNSKSYKKVLNTVLIEDIDLTIYIEYYRWTLQFPEVCERDKLDEFNSESDCKLACYTTVPGIVNSGCQENTFFNTTFKINDLSTITNTGDLIGIQTLDKILLNSSEVKLIQNVSFSNTQLTYGCIPTGGNQSSNMGPIFDQYEDLILTCRVYKVEEDTPKVIPTGSKNGTKIIPPSIFKELEEKYYWVLIKDGEKEVIHCSEDLHVENKNLYSSVYVESENFRSKKLYFNNPQTIALLTFTKK